MPKVFSCTKCEKSYETEELLARHTKLRHAEEEEEDDDDSLPGYAPVMASEERVAHRCADCGKSYPEKRLLDRHRMLRHPPPDLEFACDECEKSYETSELLARHKKLRHDDADGSLLPYSSPKIKPGDLSGKARGRGRGGRGRGPGRGLAAGGTGRVGRASGRGDFESLGKRKPAAPSVDYRPFWMILVSLIDVVLLAWEIDEEGGILPFGLNPMFGPSGETLKRLGAKYTPYILDGQAWRIFTPMFLHVGIVHLLFNLFFSLRIGLFLEKQHGYFRIMPIYLLCGLHGNILSAIFLPGVASVGASSALFGFYGIMVADLLQNWEDIHRPGRSFAGLILQILVSLVIGLLPGIDNFAHIGGLIMGIASGFVFIPSMSKSFSARRALAVSMAAICVGLLFLIELSALFSGRPSTEWCPTCSLINCLPILNWCEDPNAIFADLPGDLPV
jgi:membrane associated rhomboid family serine protease